MSDDRPVEHLAPQPWMTEAPVRAVLTALGGSGRFVGGCVRDALLGRPIGDIDVATPLRPEEVLRRLEAAGIKAVPTGLAHGTVTAVAPQRQIEITTLRRDVETFGRHARVAFTADWAEDAARRDFTMNALFLDAEGNLFDPLGGLSDLRAGRVRFVGDAAARIREDVLRLLRFYRFHAHYGRGEADAEARAACRALAGLLPGLSGERVAAELKKLLCAPDPVPTLRLAAEDGVLAVLLPEATRLDRLRGLVAIEEAPDAIRRLSALIETNAAAVAERLKLSTAERDRLLALASPLPPIDLAADERTQRRLAYRHGVDLYRDEVLLAAASSGAGERAHALRHAAEAWRSLKFPLRGRDVTALGIPAGPAVGRLLGEVEAWWEEGDFRADRRAALAELKRRAGRG
ncbi:MAG TPA: CCA tRNA nucleotidyltransferase [Stellaceae bacterium]|nr:CCA tRNA nucleotidyltransferase [Stellaceae bacterium]